MVNALIKSLAKASRINTALQVIRHLNYGMTMVEACRIIVLCKS